MPTLDLVNLRREVEEQLARGARSTVIPQLRQLVDDAGADADVDLLRSLGICLQETGEPAEAANCFRAVLAKDRNDSIARRRLARCEGMDAPAVTPRRKKSPSGTKLPSTRRRALPSHDDAKLHFVRHFPGAFRDARYLKEERDYKWAAHQLWEHELAQPGYQRLLESGAVEEICRRLRHMNGTLNLLTRFESAAMGDVAKTHAGAGLLARSIYELVYGTKNRDQTFDAFVLGLQRLNLRGTSPAKWPIVTLFPFLADPRQHIFFKPAVTQRAASRFGFELGYRPVPNAATYRAAQRFAALLATDLREWEPRDNIDIQSFIWVTNSDGYA